MKRFVLFIICLNITFLAAAQGDVEPTSSFIITGEVKSPVTINLNDLKKRTVVSIGDVIITNHLGERKSEAKGLKGVLLKDVLLSVEIQAETPRLLSEYYFVCKANDGYTVVYSWNELYNTATGDSVFIVTEKGGQPAASMKESILMISPGDFRTGRRHVKALASIDVRRAK